MLKRFVPELVKKAIPSIRLGCGRKSITILSANIQGFSSMLEKLSPEEAVATENLFKNLIDITDKYEGTIGKFTGDCMMVLFGASITHEDDPVRAVYYGIEIINELERFNEEYAINLSIYIGIDSGIVNINEIDSNYTFKGKTVNLAQRLMEMAANEILVSESVYKSTAFLFEIHPYEPLRVKGKSGKVKPYQVIGIKQQPERKHGVSELYSPLIGRNKEFEVMRSAFDEVMKAKSTVVSINGEAGVGKSRLIEEFRKITGNKVNWLSGRCPSYSKGFPFWVFLEQIRSYLGVGDFDLEIDSRRKLGKKAGSLFKEKIDKYLPYLSVFLSIKVLEHLQDRVRHLNPESLRLQEFVSIKALLRDIARNKPLVLYFEDMQWIDPESLDLLTFLLDGLKDFPIFFLLETRPEKETGLFRIKKSIKMLYEKKYTEIDLEALNTNDAKILIQNLLNIPGQSNDVLSLILKKSEGNPFYIEEIIRSFIESGILIKSNGSWKLTKDISTFEVPDTVEAVIQSRIDRLPAKTKDILGRASVIGKTFAYKILSSIGKENHLKKDLHLLEDRQFIIRRNGSSSSVKPLTDTEYVFRHILIRDIAYNGLKKNKRKKIHKSIADCMQKIFKEKIDNYYELLAYHYYNAEIFKKSYDYYRKAGEISKERYQNNVAIDCYKKAIEIHKKLFPKKRKVNLAELYEKRGDVYEIKAEYKNAHEDYSNALMNHVEVGRKTEIKRKKGNIFREESNYSEAISLYEEAIIILKDLPKSPVLSETLIDYALLLRDGKSNYKKAEEIVEQAFAKIEQKNEPYIYARGLDTLGSISLNKGDYDKALRFYKKALKIREKLNDKRGVAVAINNIGLAFHYKGELDTALKYFRKAFKKFEEIGYKRGTGLASTNIGIINHYKGKLDMALNYYYRYLNISDEIGDKKGISAASGNIGAVYYYKGELDTALKYFRRYLNISEEIENKWGIGAASVNIGAVYHDKKQFETALKYYKTYLYISEEIGSKHGIGNACLSIAKVYSETKNFEEAKDYLERSREVLTEIGDRSNLSDVFTCFSELSSSQDNSKSAVEFAEKALSLAAETGEKEKEIFALRAMGKALSKQNPKQAISYIRQAVTIAEKQKMKLEIAKSLYELVRILKKSGKTKETKKHIKEAKKIFMKSGATAWLEKVKEIQNKL